MQFKVLFAIAIALILSISLIGCFEEYGQMLNGLIDYFNDAT